MPHKLTKNQIKTVIKSGSKALFDYCYNKNIHYVVTGASGGLDSSVMLGFARETCKIAKEKNFRLTSIGLIMPCESTPKSIILGREAINKFKAKEILIDLTDINEYVHKTQFSNLNKKIKNMLEKSDGQDALGVWDESKKVAGGNIKARLRMMLGTYHVARMTKGIVLSTDNLSEFWMAFWTICGDVGDFGIIQNIMKGLELYDIAKYMGVPKKILKARPDDGLGFSKGDADQLGAEYPILDTVMVKLIKNGFDPNGSLNQLDKLPAIKNVPKKTVRKLAERCLNGAFKRRGAIILKREELGLPEIINLTL